MKYPYLVAEIKKRDIKIKDIAAHLGINRQALHFKMSGNRNGKFSVEQAIQVKQAFFPDMTVEELFKK